MTWENIILSITKNAENKLFDRCFVISKPFQPFRQEDLPQSTGFCGRSREYG